LSFKPLEAPAEVPASTIRRIKSAAVRLVPPDTGAGKAS